MRYNLESTLPINAFTPRGGRGPFTRGMTLEGGGGNPVTNAVKSVQHGIGQLNPLNTGSTVGGALQQVPGVKEAQNLGTQVFQPLEKAVVQPASAGLASFDKAVGKAIPGGWGTVAAVAASMIPGGQLAALGLSPTMLATGIGALNGSGVMRKGGSFNVQGAMMGGAMAYGMSSLAQYAQGAAAGAEGLTPTPTVDSSGALTAPAGDAIEALNASQGWTGAGAQIPSAIPSDAISAANAVASASQSVNPATGLSYGSVMGDTLAGNAPVTPSIGSQVMAGNFGDAASQIGSNISEGISGLGTKAANAYEAVTTPENYASFASDYVDNVAKTGEGIKNLISGAPGASAGAAATGINPLTAAGATMYGGMGLADLEAQRATLNDQLASDSISQQEYNAAVAEIDRSIAVARNAVSTSPFNTNPDRSATVGSTSYDRAQADDTMYAKGVGNLYSQLEPKPTVYAYGGSVDDEPGTDDLSVGGLAAIPGYAKGGQPRFLSGGGDGLSDDIPAIIGNDQPARLADGEFVVSSDVVSNLGNGSSKAGAKKLYDMMDRVRQQAHGSKKQISKVNANKVLPA